MFLFCHTVVGLCYSTTKFQPSTYLLANDSIILQSWTLLEFDCWKVNRSSYLCSIVLLFNCITSVRLKSIKWSRLKGRVERFTLHFFRWMRLFSFVGWLVWHPARIENNSGHCKLKLDKKGHVSEQSFGLIQLKI